MLTLRRARHRLHRRRQHGERYRRPGQKRPPRRLDRRRRPNDTTRRNSSTFRRDRTLRGRSGDRGRRDGRLGRQATGLRGSRRAVRRKVEQRPAAQRHGRRPQRSDRRASGSERVVRAMPNTPALIGQGIAGLYARPAVSGTTAPTRRAARPDRRAVWLGDEAQLDAVTALSGSGPAYVFSSSRRCSTPASRWGCAPSKSRAASREQTLAGSAALAATSPESPAELRRHVTSPGGTTGGVALERRRQLVALAARRAANSATNSSPRCCRRAPAQIRGAAGQAPRRAVARARLRALPC